MSVTAIESAKSFRNDTDRVARINRELVTKQLNAFYNVLEHIAGLPLEQRVKIAFDIVRGKGPTR